jgi:hypothetical protein
MAAGAPAAMAKGYTSLVNIPIGISHNRPKDSLFGVDR